MARLQSSTRALLLGICLLVLAPASALADCGTTVINDYLNDGTINGTYTVACYQQALGEIPTDADIYTDIRASITAAMNRAGGAAATTDATTDTTAAVPGGSTDGGVVGQALNSIGPKNANEVPVPVIILGALAALLILAGAGGLIAQRSSRRRKAAGGDDPPPPGDTSAPETTAV
jgi:hypothetical protein